MAAIRRKDVLFIERSGIRRRENPLQPLDLGNGLLDVHRSEYTLGACMILIFDAVLTHEAESVSKQSLLFRLYERV